jgi:hypothetical protein
MVEIAKSINSAAEWIKVAGTVLEWFGWKKAVMTGLLTVGMGAWTWVEGLSAPIIVVCCLAVATHVAYLTKLSAFYELIKQASPGAEPSTVWRRVPVFYLSQAAFLFAGVEPIEIPSLPRGPAVAWFQMLQHAVHEGEIQRTPDPQDRFKLDGDVYRADVGTRVSREELRKFAEKRNVHPSFLFPS